MEHIDRGMFIMPFHYNDKPLAQTLDEDLELIVKAEELGFSEFWIGEHHTIKCEFMMSEIMIGRAIGMTERIRLGPAPLCLPQHHPARAASQIAFLDHLSKGRINVAFGPGSAMCDLELFGMDIKQAPAMVNEAMDIILELWSSEPPYQIEGKYWQFGIEKNVDPVTTFGYQGITNCLVPGNVVADMWQTYAAGAEEAVRTAQRTNFKVAKSIFLADTTREAQRIARSNTLASNYNYVCRVFDQGWGRKMFKRDMEMSDVDCNLDYLFTE